MRKLIVSGKEIFIFNNLHKIAYLNGSPGGKWGDDAYKADGSGAHAYAIDSLTGRRYDSLGPVGGVVQQYGSDCQFHAAFNAILLNTFNGTFGNGYEYVSNYKVAHIAAGEKNYPVVYPFSLVYSEFELALRKIDRTHSQYLREFTIFCVLYADLYDNTHINKVSYGRTFDNFARDGEFNSFLYYFFSHTIHHSFPFKANDPLPDNFISQLCGSDYANLDPTELNTEFGLIKMTYFVFDRIKKAVLPSSTKPFIPWEDTPGLLYFFARFIIERDEKGEFLKNPDGSYRYRYLDESNKIISDKIQDDLKDYLDAYYALNEILSEISMEDAVNITHTISQILTLSNLSNSVTLGSLPQLFPLLSTSLLKGDLETKTKTIRVIVNRSLSQINISGDTLGENTKIADLLTPLIWDYSLRECLYSMANLYVILDRHRQNNIIRRIADGENEEYNFNLNYGDGRILDDYSGGMNYYPMVKRDYDISFSYSWNHNWERHRFMGVLNYNYGRIHESSKMNMDKLLDLMFFNATIGYGYIHNHDFNRRSNSGLLFSVALKLNNWESVANNADFDLNFASENFYLTFYNHGFFDFKDISGLSFVLSNIAIITSLSYGNNGIRNIKLSNEMNYDFESIRYHNLRFDITISMTRLFTLAKNAILNITMDFAYGHYLFRTSNDLPLNSKLYGKIASLSIPQERANSLQITGVMGIKLYKHTHLKTYLGYDILNTERRDLFAGVAVEVGF